MTDFAGFPKPEQNYSKLPHNLIDVLPLFKSLSEMKCVLYILRHTWGYSEYAEPKHLTIDEFMHGRKRKDGTRLDSGTGLSKPSVISGLQEAEKHGFISVQIDDSDLARVSKFYRIKIAEVVSNSFTSGVKEFDTGGKESLQRSEKETISKKPKERTKNLPPLAVAASPQVLKPALGVPGFGGEAGLRDNPEEPQKRVRKQKPQQSALCKLIRRNIGKFVQKLAEELELRLELYSMRYDDDPLYREFIEKVIVPQWVFVNEKGQTIHLATRAEAVQGIIESEDQWTAYQVKHQPEANPFEGMSSTEIQRYLEGPVVTPLPPPLNFQDPA